jgi:hypothetical protein
MDRPESGMRPKHGFELLQNLFAQCDQLFVIRQWHSQSPPQSLITPFDARRNPLSLCVVAHRVARLRERPSSLTAQIIDRVVELAGDDLQDWQLRNELADFKDEVLKKIDFSKPGYSDWTDIQTDKFIEKLGLQAKKREKLQKTKKTKD